MRLVPAIKSGIRGIERDIPVSEVRTMDQYVARSAGQPRFNMILIGTLAALALVQAIGGVSR